MGCDVVELAAPVRRRLRGLLPAGASIANPIDMLAGASGEQYRRTIDVLAASHACDAILTINVAPLLSVAGDVAREIAVAAESAPQLTLASVFMGAGVVAAEPVAGAARVPSFGFPEEAVRALAHAARYGAWRSRPAGTVIVPADARPDEAAAIIAAALGAGTAWLGPEQVAALLDCYGLPLVPAQVVRGAGDAAEAAADLAGPVALKALVGGLVYKGDAGAVRLGLHSGAEVRRAASEIRAAVSASGHRLDGFVVAPMVATGRGAAGRRRPRCELRSGDRVRPRRCDGRVDGGRGGADHAVDRQRCA